MGSGHLGGRHDSALKFLDFLGDFLGPETLGVLGASWRVDRRVLRGFLVLDS